MIFARYHNAKFVYTENILPAFPTGRPDFYFEPWSDEVLPGEEIRQISSHIEEQDLAIRTEWFPPEFKDVYDFHSSLMRKIYRPSERVRLHLANNAFLNQTIEPLKGRYIGVHVRWGDKIQGSTKETEFIPLQRYFDACDQIRQRTHINTIVLCCDTTAAIQSAEELNKTYNFKLLYDETEVRGKNDPSDAFVQKAFRMDKNDIVRDYLACFVGTEVLLKAHSIVANCDSGFVLVPVQIRNNPNTVVNMTGKKALWGLSEFF